MKKIFTLVAILFSVTAFASGNPRPNESKMAIRSNSDAFIQVVIDGRQYNVNRNGFVLDNIRSGRHRIEVYKVDNYGMFRKRPQLVYRNTMVVKPWESLNININRFERVWVDTRFDRDDRRGNDRDYGRDRDYDRGPDYNDRDGRYGRH
ncbi:hypothetical protein FAM09_06460 [Niastella caeni]|uniref:PEGA domain-containing protein n=1 Tax=Niastella caeni TaxID=2569763 RepID=A0A4S8I0R7_9BACT|nr:hypothetical protein [Niastella caeni]THU41738.1 hypothetical protein FAM09_06460 [Niastella caeni]